MSFPPSLFERVFLMPRILIIDAESSTFDVLMRFTPDDRAELLWASTPEEGLQIALGEEGVPDLIVLDLLMPGARDGLWTLRQIRKTEELCGANVAILSFSDERHTARCLGANQYLHKPVSRRRWLEIIDELDEVKNEAHEPVA